MKYLLLLLCSVLLLSGCEQNDSVRVLCYNIKTGLGMDGVRSLERIAGVIRHYEPDIVLLQEMDQNTGRSGQVDQPEELRRLTGMAHVHFAPAIDFDGGRYGLAMLFHDRFEQENSQVVPIPATEGREKRVVQVVTLRSRSENGVPALRVLNTHLDYHEDDADRMAGAAVISRILDSHPDMPTIIAGDFNDTPDSRVISTMRERVTLLSPLDPTAPADTPRATIDYIFGANLAGLQVMKSEVVDEPVASDHRPVFVELGLPEEQSL